VKARFPVGGSRRLGVACGVLLLVRMKSSLTTVLTVVLIAAPGVALADAMLLSSTQEDYTITYDKPSGDVATATLYKGTDTLGYLALPAKPTKALSITVSDGSGTEMVRGVLTDNRSYLLVVTPKGARLVAAGLVAQTASTPPHMIGIVNALPGTFRVDLFGDTGEDGLKGVKVSATFDPKATTKLPASNNRYRGILHLPDGTSVKGLSAVDAGSWVVIHKNYQGAVTLSAAGYIDPPTRSKKR